eukprot:Gb_08053 [translate_table: standard]
MAARHNKMLSSLGLITTRTFQTPLTEIPNCLSKDGNFISFCRTGRLNEALDSYAMSRPGITVDYDAYASLLQVCAKANAMAEGKQLHSHVIVIGMKQNVGLKTELLNLYAKCGNLEDARQMFDKISKPDVFSWNTMIRCYARQGQSEEALTLYYQMQRTGTQMDSFTFPCALKACAALAALHQGKQIHNEIVRTGFESDIFVGNALVDMYAKCGNIENARLVFDEMANRDLVSWNAIIAGCAQSRRCDEALELFHCMLLTGVKPDSVTISSILPACAYLTALQRGREIHDYVIRSGVDLVSFVENALIDMYAKCGRIDDACQVFDKMSLKNVVSWNSMISGFILNNHGDDALILFEQMQLAGMKANPITVLNVLPACAHSAALQNGKEIHYYIIRSGFNSDITVINALVAMYAQCGSIEDARKVFDKMPQRDVCSWTAMIAGYNQNSECDKAFYVFHQMQLAGVRPNSVTIASVVTACANSASLQLGKEIHNYVIKCGFESDVIVGNALIAMYAKCENLENANRVFDKASQKSMVSWNTMITAYVQNGYGNHALKLFREMQLSGAKPNSITIASVLPACAYLVGLQQGKEIHDYIFRSGFESDVFVGSAVVDMYAKCGSIKDACQVFDNMSHRDVVAWTAMIVGYAMHGHAEDALALFSQMRLKGMKPNKITFTGVLSACSHAGLVAKGWQYFDLMSQDYSITPSMEHYACMVDLLGRAGQLYEAIDFIENMPLEPNARVWGALLGACRIHCNTELGKYVAEHLFQLENESTGNYVLLSNIYAAAGRWDDAEVVRKAMKKKGLQKIPGCSWIEVKNTVHTFLAGDTSHPQTQKIYAMLESLAVQMEVAGYVPDKNFALLDAEEDAMEDVLCGHSENHGIAFGVMNT